MPSNAAEKNAVSLDSIPSILNELLRLNTEIDDLREDLIAKGVPFSSVNVMLELSHKGAKGEYELMLESSLRVAEEQLGVGAIQKSELVSSMEELLSLDEDLQYVRKVARGFELDPMATNMLTQIVRKNPGDRGQRVLELINDYARASGIKVKGFQVVQGGEVAEKKESVLPDIKIPEPKQHSLSWYRDLAVEISLGLLLAYTAITLLT